MGERLSNARQTLNAVSGLGIMQNRLPISMCYCLVFVFWSVVVPNALFGSELLQMSDEIISLLESFQEYAGEKIQRLYRLVPNVCAFHALGWMRLERLVEVKKIVIY